VITGPLLSLATFLLVQAGAAIWWASRISTEMRMLNASVAMLATKIDRLDTSVTTHETAIAILRAMNEYDRGTFNGGAHERTR